MAYNDFFEPEVDESILPSDDTPSLGGNYGMDGFQFDSDYGEGVLDGARLPESAGMSALPDGIVRTAAPYDFASGVVVGEPEGSHFGVNLSEMLEENSLAELGWLHGEQDPNRLPKNPVDRGIAELEKAWGTASGYTTGNLVPNRDNVYQAPTGDPHQDGFDATQDADKAKILRQAMRRSAYGHPITQILRDVAASLSVKAQREIAPDLQRVAADHGLRGKVFIEANAFPGLKKGKFAKEIHRHCASARYIVVPKGMDANTREVIASVTGKVPVTSVPWKEAFDHYAPRLKSTGHKVASEGDYRTRLQVTFASKERVAHESTVPVQTFAVDKISADEARSKFAAMKAERIAAPDPAKKRAAQEQREAKQQIVRWVNAGLLSQEQAVRAHKATSTPHDLVIAAANMITASHRKAATYQGDGAGKTAMLSTYERKLAPLVDTETLRAAKAKQAAVQQLGRWVKQGFLTAGKASRLASSGMAPRDMVKAAAQVVADAAAQAGLTTRDIDQSKLAAVGLYSGVGEGALTAREGPKTANNNPSEARRMAKWVLKQMNEGWAGKDLSALVRKKFAGRTASAAITQLREAHEGLAGFVYVTASVYASDKGTTGCEEGALQHRANSLRYVLAMNRCASCVFATEGKCQKYHKTLLASNEGLEKIQRKNIKSANMDDAEATGSLFAPTYQDDYSLQYDDTVEVEDDLPKDVLDDVLMDGVATVGNEGDVYEGIDFDDAGF